MTSRELFDRIQTWNSMFEQIEIPPAQNPEAKAIRKEVERKINYEKLFAVSQLEVTNELIGAPVEKNLRKAIDYTRTSDLSKLKEIHKLLIKVQKYMYKNGLY